MRIAALVLSFALASPVAAQDRTALLGLGVEQDRVAVAMSLEGGTYVATLAAAAFDFTLPEPFPEVLGVTFGPEGLFDLLDLPPETGLFGPGTGYARETGLDAAHFMTDPLCASQYYGPGFNYLDAERRTGNRYPVAAIQVDSASRRCDVPERLPSDTNLIGRINPLYVVVRDDDSIERLILRFVGS